MAKPVAQHYIDEWERHPDLFVFQPTCQYNDMAALRVAAMASTRFGFPMPEVKKNRRRWGTSKCECLVWSDPHKLSPYDGPSTITMRGGFTPGEFLHELAHAWCFARYGDHDHGRLFMSAMDDLCYWFRLEEQAQAAFFP